MEFPKGFNMRSLFYISLITSSVVLASCSTPAPKINSGKSYPIFSAEKRTMNTNNYNHAFDLQNGSGVAQNYRGAESLYAASSSMGDARAENNLGVMAIRGQGAKVNYKKAIRHFQKAAQGGSAAAHYNIGLMYESGSGVQRDFTMAKLEYRTASRMGFAPAQYRMGMMLENGLGGSVNNQEASRFYQMAAMNGNNGSIEKLKSLSTKREITLNDVRHVVAVENCDDCNNESERNMAGRGLNSLSEMAQRGEASAQYNLGVRLLGGISSVRDPSEAARHFTLAARQGYAPAQRQIAQMHLRGEGVARSSVIGHAWLNLAARQNDAEAVTANIQKNKLELSMTAAQIQQAQALANSWSMKGR